MRWTLFIIICVFMASCASELMTVQDAFFVEVADLCGKSYEGKIVYPHSDKQNLKNQQMIMTVSACSDTVIRIPVRIGDEHKETWFLSKTERGLQLQHDATTPDGSLTKERIYGGYAINRGNGFSQSFMADTHTLKLYPESSNSEWTCSITPDGKRFSYIFTSNKKVEFRADFDLTTPIVIRPIS